MNKFGAVKSKILNKLTESYKKDDKTEVKDILKSIKENKDFKEMYLFYEEIENKYIEDKETAKLFVEGVESMISQPKNDFIKFYQSLDKKLGDVEITKNELYESLDQLMIESNLSNIEDKIKAKKYLYDYLTKKKDSKEINKQVFTVNENLLHSVLTNNFNVLYTNTLNEEQQNTLKNILSLSQEELSTQTNELKENILNSVETLLNESTDLELKNKLDNVKKEVNEMSLSRYNYYRLSELKNGLN